MIKKKSSAAEAPQLEPAGPGPCAARGPTGPGQPSDRGDARLAAAGGGAGTICSPPLAALGFSVRPRAASPAPGLRAASHAPGAHRALGQSRARPGRAGPVLDPAGRPSEAAPGAGGSSSPCASRPAQTTPPHPDPHTLSQLVVLFKTGGRPL